MSVPNPIVVPLTISSNVHNIGLSVQSNAVALNLGVSSVIVSGLNEHYTGDYEFTPTEDAQTIAIAEKVADRNIIINPIPSNYGLITWTGHSIIVS